MKFLYLFFPVVISLISCGGGSGGGSSDGNIDTLNSDNINGPLSGKLFIGNLGSGAWLLDLSTGLYSKVPGTEHWETDEHNYSGVARFYAYPILDGSERYVETVNNCKRISTGLHDECIVIHDIQGNKLNGEEGLIFPGEISGAVKPSRDGYYLLTAWENERSSNAAQVLVTTPIDGSGNDISVGNQEVFKEDFDWLNDNRIVYASGQNIYLSQPLEATGHIIATFDESQGRPTEIAASPDGKKIAFTLASQRGAGSDNRGTTWILDIDSPNPPRQLTTETDLQPEIHFPTWSPDSQWLLVVIGGDRGVSPSGNVAPGGLFAIKADSELVDFSSALPSTALEVLNYSQMTVSDDKGELDNSFGVVETIIMAWMDQ